MIASGGSGDKTFKKGTAMKTWQALTVGIICVLFAGQVTPATAQQTLIDEWGTAKFPAPPALKPAKLNAKETALLVLDFTKQTCSMQRRPRCANQVANVQRFVTAARAKGALIIYSVAVPKSVPADILPALAPAAGEEVLPPLDPTSSSAAIWRRP